MLDLSQKDCCDYLIKKIGDVIEEAHIKVYRQDYNFMPHSIWQAADADDRRGATENLYVQGYLRFWDALKERFPDLVIDSCASGGRRIDLETAKRSVVLHRCDGGCGPRVETKPVETDPETKPVEQSGCKGAVVSGMAVLAMAAACAVVLKKKD